MGTFHRVCMSAAVVFLSATTARVAPAEDTSALKTFSSIGKESRRSTAAGKRNCSVTTARDA